MRKIILLVAIAGFVPAVEAADDWQKLFTRQTASGEIDGWKSFHNDGAKTGDVWKLSDDGVLVCRGTPLGYLYTEKKFTDVDLEFEWRWPPESKPGSGGLLLRVTGENKVWPKSLEVQLNHSQAGDLWGLCGYTLSGPSDRTESLENPRFGKLTHVKFARGLEKPPGQWNHCAVQLKGPAIRVQINSEPANEATDCEVSAGTIVLTAEGAEIQFRNLRIRR